MFWIHNPHGSIYNIPFAIIPYIHPINDFFWDLDSPLCSDLSKLKSSSTYISEWIISGLYICTSSRKWKKDGPNYEILIFFLLLWNAQPSLTPHFSSLSLYRTAHIPGFSPELVSQEISIISLCIYWERALNRSSRGSGICGKVLLTLIVICLAISGLPIFCGKFCSNIFGVSNPHRLPQ